MMGLCVTIPFEAAWFRFPYLSPLCTTAPALTRFIYPDALLAPSASVDDGDQPSNQESARSLVATTGPEFQREYPSLRTPNKGRSLGELSSQAEDEQQAVRCSNSKTAPSSPAPSVALEPIHCW